MSEAPRFFESSVEPNAEGTLALALPTPHWVLWGRPVRFVIHGDSSSLDRVDTFHFTARFSKARRYEEHHNIQLDRRAIAETGDSNYAVQRTEYSFTRHGRQIDVGLILNEASHVAGLASSPIVGVSFSEAVSAARDLCSVLRVSLSASTNVPCVLDVLQVNRADGLLISTTVWLPFPTNSLPELRFENMPAMRPFLALYVEGLCSESAFYRFLCFFKILDKLLSFVNPRLQNLCRKYSLERPDLNGIVPKDPFDSIAPEYVGMKYTALRDSLQGQYRNAIAHIDLSSDIHPFNADAEAAVARAAMTLAFAANDLLGRTYDVLIKMGANGIDVVDLNARPDV